MTDPKPANPLATEAPWTLVAEGYDETTRHFLEQYSRSGLERLRLSPELDAVDVACGPGTTALLLARAVRRVTCLDFSPAMLERLDRNVAAASLDNVERYEGDGQALPFSDATFDVGVSMFGLMFFPDRRQGIAELCRVLRPGGQALVSSWAPVSQSSLMTLLTGALRAGDPSIPEPGRNLSSLENPEVFEAEMHEAGFVDVDVQPVRHGLEVTDVAALWEDMVRGGAPLVLLRQKLGEAEWARRSRIAVDHIAAALEKLPATLESTAYVATARKP